MRSVIAVISAVSLLVVQTPTAGFAQAANPRPAVPATWTQAKAAVHRGAIIEEFKAFPNGGDSLKARLADQIVKDPQFALELVKYVRSTKTLSYSQKLAAERGIAAALERLGVMAADMPAPVYKASPAVVEPAVDYSWLWWLLAAGGVVGVLCATDVLCGNNDDDPGVPKKVSPN